MQMKTNIQAVGGRRLSSPDFWSFLLVPFIVGALTVSYVKGLSIIVILYGLIVSSIFTLYFLYRRLGLQPEVLIYFVWIIWSLGGLTNVIDRELYSAQLKTIIQIGFLIFVVAGISALRKDISQIMLSFVLGGLIMALSLMMTGESGRIFTGSEWRLEGLTGNSNEFAYCLLFVVFAVFYFFRGSTAIWLRILLAAILTATAILVVFSGSRKGLLGVLAFILLWWMYCKDNRLSRSPLRGYLILVMVLGAVYFFTGHVISRTYVGQRMEALEGDSSVQMRVTMYEEGLVMIKHYPFFGVGLNNYRTLSSSGLYSHSDYIEVAANTGIVGAILYFSIYVVLWRRLTRLRKLTADPDLVYTAGILKASVGVILLVALGRPNIASKVTWLFLAGAIGYSWSIERAITSFKRRLVRR